MENPNEEYTLVLNEHANNFSISLSNLLQRNELVDVTLAGDGGIFNAHRLVLSVVSPYFQRMFTQLPTNQQAIGNSVFGSVFFLLVSIFNLFFFFRLYHFLQCL